MKKQIKNKKIEYSYRGALNYIKESRVEIFAIIGLFFAMALIGFFNSEQFSFFDELLRKILEKSRDLKGFDLISFIFWNNLQSSFLGMTLGIFLGIFPVWGAILNGAVLGYVFGNAYEATGILEFWKILPHGVFELPAVFISLGLGLRLGIYLAPIFVKAFYSHYWKKNKAVSLIPIIFFIISLFIPFLYFNNYSPIYIEAFSRYVLIIFFIILSFIGNTIFTGIISFIIDMDFRKVKEANSAIKGFLSSLNVFFYIVLPLLIVAAMIEAALISLLS